jgi:hypothetical protein
MHSTIRDPVLYHPPDPGSGIKKLGIRIRDKTSRIRNTECDNYGRTRIADFWLIKIRSWSRLTNKSKTVPVPVQVVKENQLLQLVLGTDSVERCLFR